jgi:hypothetical protein
LTNFGLGVRLPRAPPNILASEETNMTSSDRILLEKIMRDSSPMQVLDEMASFIKKEAELSRTGKEEFGLRKIVALFKETSNKVLSTLENLTEYQPKHRVYSSPYYSPRHAKEIFKS